MMNIQSLDGEFSMKKQFKTILKRISALSLVSTLVFNLSVPTKNKKTFESEKAAKNAGYKKYSKFEKQ